MSSSFSYSLQNQFLVSMPQLEDANFSNTLTYICEHDEEGAMGIIINRPAGLTLDQLLPHLDMEISGPKGGQIQVYAGGPVELERGFVLHTSGYEQNWLSSQQLTDDLWLTTSVDILAAIANGRGPSEYIITLGYAGWGAGQLDQEMASNAWLSCPATLDIIFRTEADQRIDAAASSIGISLDQLMIRAGHA